jgi:ribosomal protein S27E
MIDKKFHDAFKVEAFYQPLVFSDVRCRNCGTKLKTYYAEARLYSVKCCYCETITLVRADNPTQAARYVGDYKEADNEQREAD